MFEIIPVLIPLLVADFVNPVLFAFLVYAASGPRPVFSSSALLFGHTLAYFAVGVGVALGLEKLADYLANPSSIDYLLGLLVGLLLLWLAVPGATKQSQQSPEERGALTPLAALGLGAVVNFVGAPFALPYFAAIDQILKADLSTIDALTLLLGYNLLYALPFMVVPGMVGLLGDRSKPLLQQINGVLERGSAFLMPLILALVGAALVADALFYFMTGTGLF